MIRITRSAFIFMIVFSAILATAQTKIIAHRGFSGIAPENTIIAFQKAIESNADFIELDVHETKNDSIVVIHDSSIDRTSSNGIKGKIAELNYDELANLSVGYPSLFGDQYENQKIPTLREALEVAKGKTKVCIEIKVYGAEQEILKITKDLGVNDEVILFSFY
jgi:glycerophosphoryl diester phosphodiesterase